MVHRLSISINPHRLKIRNVLTLGLSINAHGWRSDAMKSFTLAIVMLVASVRIFAQDAPTGSHYAGRSTDTGHAGGIVNATGAFPASIPLELPFARGELNIPLRIVYGGRLGAAGLGWDIPISYIKRDHTLARSRPISEPNTALLARDKLTLSLFNQTYELVPAGDMWLTRTGTLELAARQDGASWIVYDGKGLTYRFTEPAHLVAGGLWLLKSISGPSGASLEASYETNILPLTGSGGFEINLTRIAYNKHPTSWCMKNEIVLAYDRLTTAAKLSVLGDKILTRQSVVKTIDVVSRATCGTAPAKVRQYAFSYEPDADTSLPRLMHVKLFGRENTPESSLALPIASYAYGSATSTRKLRYEKTQTIPLPMGAEASAISMTLHQPNSNTPDSTLRYSMLQSLIDISGDGRPDFLYRKFDKFWVAQNRPDLLGQTTFAGDAAAQLFDPLLARRAFATQASLWHRFWYYTTTNDPATTSEDSTGVRVSANHNVDNTWRQLIDVNGDGRLDLVDAAEEKHRWIIYLNTPAANGVKWERRSFNVERLGRELAALGHLVDHNSSAPPEYVPLARRSTSGGVQTMQCWEWNGQEWKWWREGVTTGQCRTAENPVKRSGEGTITEWELMDVNGDGYPDFLFNSTPVRFQVSNPDRAGTQAGEKWVQMAWVPFGPHRTNEVRALFNVAGLTIDENRDPFSTQVVLTNIGGEAGVAQWVTLQEDSSLTGSFERQLQWAGFADVNGDGLADRVHSKSAYLGVYQGPGKMFSQVSIPLPGVLSEHFSQRRVKCETQPDFSVAQAAGLRDLTGDGIPDYFADRQVWIGTGAGFAPPAQLEGDIAISGQVERCDGKSSKTTKGLFDLDGDGKPESVHLLGAALEVYQLVEGGRGAPNAGRLTSVDNGYGAKTNISYKNAKDDSLSPHQVPFPEMVVSSVETIGSHGLGGNVAEVRYAYGHAELVYDAALDRFVFPGYRRFVELVVHGLRNGSATVTDAWSLTEFQTSLTREERWLRIKRVGMPRSIYKFRLTTLDPWSLLPAAVNDERVIGATHYNWGAKYYKLADGAPASYWCLDMVAPYDYRQSVLYNLGDQGLNVCRSHGFTFRLATESWYGWKPPPANENVRARSWTRGIDDYGRVTHAQFEGDTARDEDDFCLENTYAAPPNNSYPRVLTALASRRIVSCNGPTTYASNSFTYDQLPVGSVADGRLTSHIVENRATDTGELIRTVRKFEADYDNAGNLSKLRLRRDGVRRSVTFNYDQFGLVVTGSIIEADGIPRIANSAEYSAITLERLNTTDANGTVRGVDFDGFGRPIRSTITSPGGGAAVLSTIVYEGFDGLDQQGRRTIIKEFPKAVAPELVETAPARTRIVLFDELGRTRRTDVDLGADYGNNKIVVGARIYDPLGRVAFEADPYKSTDDPTKVYGTSFHFKNTGDIDCLIRGQGPQLLNRVTDATVERFPTCFERNFHRLTQSWIVRDAASLQPGSPQEGVVNRSSYTALGRLLDRTTVQGSAWLEHASFSYDRLGQQTSMTRYLDSAGNFIPVNWNWRLDSVGQVLELSEPDVAKREFTYSDWGELVETRWDGGRHVFSYDALGRVTYRGALTNGTPDQTETRYSYDVGVRASAHVSPTNVLGRMASATWKTGQVSFSYDAQGRVNARSFTDNNNGVYIEKSRYLDDGSLAALEFNLPDHNYEAEIVSYGYDSAGRLKTISHADSTGTDRLYEATFDVFGRINAALYGDGTTYGALYAESGRRLMRAAWIESGDDVRGTIFGSYDAVGRENWRAEVSGGVTTITEVSYDALGRVSSSKKTQDETTLSRSSFTYDSLGNVLRMDDLGTTLDVKISHTSSDPDRMCRINYGTQTGSGCNVNYDPLGNISRQPTRTGTRQYRYFASGAVRLITDERATAFFEYDAFGKVQQLDVVGSTNDKRQDRRYGRYIERKELTDGNGVTSSHVFRRIPGPGGFVGSRRGPTDSWIYEFGERRGNRYFTDKDGAVVQELNYRTFGEPRSTGAAPGSPGYTTYQWNGRDALAAFGLSHLGARLYDPAIGRFLSRDPIRVPRGAASTNPYAFALNDPINLSDPSGRDPADESAQFDDEQFGTIEAFSMMSDAGFWGVDVLDTAATRYGLNGPGARLVGRVSLFGDVADLLWSFGKMTTASPEREGEATGRFWVSAANVAATGASFIWSKVSWVGLSVKIGTSVGMWRWELREDDRMRSQGRIRDLMYPIKVETEKLMRDLKIAELAQATVCVAEEPACRERLPESSSMSAADEDWYNSDPQWNGIFPTRPEPPVLHYIYPQPLRKPDRFQFPSLPWLPVLNSSLVHQNDERPLP